VVGNETDKVRSIQSHAKHAARKRIAAQCESRRPVAFGTLLTPTGATRSHKVVAVYMQEIAPIEGELDDRAVQGIFDGLTLSCPRRGYSTPPVPRWGRSSSTSWPSCIVTSTDSGTFVREHWYGRNAWGVCQALISSGSRGERSRRWVSILRVRRP
jgi:hypothetical protein